MKEGNLVYKGKENKTIDWELVFDEVALSMMRDTTDKEIDTRKFDSLKWMIELKNDLGTRLELNKPNHMRLGHISVSSKGFSLK